MTPDNHDIEALQDEVDDLHEHPRDTRRPGEAAFTLLLVAFSLFLVWSAFGISGFEALSAPGTVPMATTLIMVITGGIIAWRTVRLPQSVGEAFGRDILPPLLIVMALLLLGYALLLRPLGFLPTSALFLILAIKLLWRQGWMRTLLVSLGALVLIYFVFRIVFTVLMPAGIVPEGEMLQWVRNLIPGGN
ncbi:tripartite tricarboxylate transporter TctB family protein [Paracoccus sp. TK19116]|uniref:Tripartite tricarboxylate transporter TctB family protein n=1 Tax=Paracoccus albicereus TaxID=2922394 RepID=A0ABT1MUV5_9RHOB|nr:tripartite tricarboxylate transporter TctB family protein [Paracoccus albicereus]MCQ0972113.1 tripartite tricarboxylate transporter TctB family protein [Paracoccus albicereus]